MFLDEGASANRKVLGSIALGADECVLLLSGRVDLCHDDALT